MLDYDSHCSVSSLCGETAQMSYSLSAMAAEVAGGAHFLPWHEAGRSAGSSEAGPQLVFFTQGKGLCKPKPCPQDPREVLSCSFVL